MTTCRVSKLSSDAMVNSPSTSATDSSDGESSAPRMFGTIDPARSPSTQPAPRLRAASASVATSIAPRPASIAR